MVDITFLCGGLVELELSFLIWLSKKYDIIISNGRIYIDKINIECYYNKCHKF
nr:MAG TPA: hypothetical protein [Caudoviricetes sp.]